MCLGRCGLSVGCPETFDGQAQRDPLVGSDGGTTFSTAEGASIGTVLPELQVLYGDQLEISTAPDECVSGTAHPIVLGGSVFGLLDRAPADDARVSILLAGMGVGC